MIRGSRRKKSPELTAVLLWERVWSVDMKATGSLQPLTSPRCCSSRPGPPLPRRRSGPPARPLPHRRGCSPAVLLFSTHCTRGRTAPPNRTGHPASTPQLPKQDLCYFITHQSSSDFYLLLPLSWSWSLKWAIKWLNEGLTLCNGNIVVFGNASRYEPFTVYPS